MNNYRHISSRVLITSATLSLGATVVSRAAGQQKLKTAGSISNRRRLVNSSTPTSVRKVGANYLVRRLKSWPSRMTDPPMGRLYQC